MSPLKLISAARLGKLILVSVLSKFVRREVMPFIVTKMAAQQRFRTTAT